MPPTQDEERALTLSLYLDGELDAEQARAVEEKLRLDAAWKCEYDALVASEQRVSKAVENNWHDVEFTERVMEQVKAHSTGTAVPAWAAAPGALDPLPAGARSGSGPSRAWARWVRVRVRVGWVAAAAALVLLAAGLKLFWPPKAVPAQAAPVHVADFDGASAQLRITASEGAPEVAGALYTGQLLSARPAETGPARVRWSDGSVVWLGPGASLEGTSGRGFALKSGLVLVEAVKRAEPYVVRLPDESLVEALGTRFELEMESRSGSAVEAYTPCNCACGHAGSSCAHGGKAARVRVLEGRVRRRDQAGRVAEVLGGQTLETDFQVRAFDPREIALRWGGPAAAAGAGLTRDGRPEPGAPWPQWGGSPGHTGLTPLRGPAGLAARRFFPFPPHPVGSKDAAHQYAPAVAGAQSRVYVLRRAEGGTTQLIALDLSAAAPDWRPCGAPLPGNTQHPPVISPKGLIVAGATGKTVQAWDPEKQAVAWSVDVGSSVYALCAAYDGTILCSTGSGPVALDENGVKRWAYEGIKDLQAPVCVTSTGNIFVVSRAGEVGLLSREGRVLKSLAWEGQSGVLWAPVARDDGSAWIASTGGALATASAKGIANSFKAEAALSAPPLASGVLALGNRLHSQRVPGGFQVTLPISGEIVALVAERAGCLYAGIQNRVYRLTPDPKGGEPALEFADAHSEIVRGGIAILPGRLLVTTTAGVQIFE